MRVEYENGLATFEPGLVDVHAHPRVFDPITDIPLDPTSLDTHEGKAGLAAYSEVALASGITVMVAMSNEFYRVPDPAELSGSRLVQFPIATADRAAAMQVAIRTQARTLMAFNYGLDPTAILLDDGVRLDVARVRKDFREGGSDVAALKIFGDESTGGNNVPVDRIPELVREWYGLYPAKPTVMHLEDGNVRRVLEELSETDFGREAPLHLAHVSSKEELEAVIWAKEQGMNVTCEVTPHHLFIDGSARELAGSYGCMKPSLKTLRDIQFLWDNIDYIDIIASDCAPHKVSDKEGPGTVWGVANHTVMMPLLLGAVEAGRLTIEDVYQKMVVAPRERFNLPFNDGTSSIFQMDVSYVDVHEVERDINPQYGQNVFLRLEELGSLYTLRGVLRFARSGASEISVPQAERPLTHRRRRYATHLGHLVTPK